MNTAWTLLNKLDIFGDQLFGIVEGVDVHSLHIRSVHYGLQLGSGSQIRRALSNLQAKLITKRVVTDLLFNPTHLDKENVC